MTHVLRTDMTIDHPLDPVWSLFGDAANLQPLTPPELRFRILTPTPIEMGKGTRIEYRIRLFGVPLHWLTEITCWEPGVRFVDEQLEGPFQRWTHEHTFEAVDAGTTRIRDEVHYVLPFGALGRLGHPLVRARLERIFDYREARVRELLRAAPGVPARGVLAPPMAGMAGRVPPSPDVPPPTASRPRVSREEVGA